MNDYQAALEAAGAKVLAFQEFGSYQGEWLAQVVAPDGKKGWIKGYYGSCSGCDQIQAIKYETHEHADGQYIYGFDAEDGFDPKCPECVANKNKIADVGREHLATIVDVQALAAELASGAINEWGGGDDEWKMLEFLRKVTSEG